MMLHTIDSNAALIDALSDVEKQLCEFRELIVLHQYFSFALEKLLRTLSTAPRGSLLYVVGPTGVGKTALIDTLMSRFIDADSDVVTTSSNRYSKPIFIEAINPTKYSFEWKDMFTRLLSMLGEPGGLSEKREFARQCQTISATAPAMHSRAFERYDYVLMQSLATRLQYVKPLFIVIDEGHAIRKMSRSAASFADQVDVLKSLANITQTPIIITGTYLLKDVIYEGDEATRRSRVIHFPRYAWSADAKKYHCEVLEALSNDSPRPLDFDPLASVDFFLRKDVGCVGILKDWWCEAIGNAILEDRQYVSLSDFEATALDDKQIVKLINEIRFFETSFLNAVDESVIKDFCLEEGSRESSNNISMREPSPAERPTTKKGHKPGESAPFRFPVQPLGGSNDNC